MPDNILMLFAYQLFSDKLCNFKELCCFSSSSPSICDLLSENRPCSHLVVIRETAV